MDWQHINFDWNRARAFLAAAEEGSLSAAARALGAAQPTIGRQVTALEEELDVTLIERVTHGIELTETGLELVEHIRAMSEAASRASLVAEGHSLSLEGTVAITASEVMAAHLLPPIIERLRTEYPAIQVDIVASSQPQNLRWREADIAVRSFQPSDPELFAQKVRESGAFLYATPAYLESLGSPTEPGDFAGADFIGFDRSDRFIEALNAYGLAATKERVSIICENQLVQWEMVKRGLGVGLMMEEIGDREDGVRRVLPELAPIVVPTWLTTHREVHTSRRVRAVFDVLADELSA